MKCLDTCFFSAHIFMCCGLPSASDHFMYCGIMRYTNAIIIVINISTMLVCTSTHSTKLMP